MKKLSFLLTAMALGCIAMTVAGQESYPTVKSVYTYGGEFTDISTSADRSSTGETVITGMTFSENGFTTNHGGGDGFLIALDPSGETQWNEGKCFGGSAEDQLNDVKITSTGYIAVGGTESTDGDISTNKGGRDGWVVKVNFDGNVDWMFTFGGTGDDNFEGVSLTASGEYIISGYSDSNDGNVSGNHGEADAWVVKLSANGSLLWSKLIGGSGNDFFEDLLISGSNTLLTGGSESSDGDISFFYAENAGATDGLFVNIENGSGVLQVVWLYGGEGEDYFTSIVPSDNLFLLTGSRDEDSYKVLVDDISSLYWEDIAGTSGMDVISSTYTDGNFAVSATTSNGPNYDFYLEKALVGEYSPETIWSHSYGSSSDNEEAVKILPLSNSGYWLLANSDGTDGDLSEAQPKGGMDIQVITFDIGTSTQAVSVDVSEFTVCPNLITSGAVSTFTLGKSCLVTASIYDLAGRKIQVLVNEVMEGGKHTVKFNRSNLESGVYFLSLTAGGEEMTQKLIVQ